MNKITDFIKQVKGWGVTAIFAGALAVFLFIIGWKFASGISLGVFITRNWDIIGEYIKEKRKHLDNYI